MSYASAAVSLSPDAFYEFNETSGTVFAEATNTARDLTLYGTLAAYAVPVVPSSAGTGVTFPATACYLRTDGYIFQRSSQCTFMFWFYASAYPTNDQVLMAVSPDGGGNGGSPALIMMTSGNLQIGTWNNGGQNVTTTTPPTLNTWHHIVASIGPAGMKVRVDGVTIATHANTGGSLNDSCKLYIHGANGGNTTNPVKIAAPGFWHERQLIDAETDGAMNDTLSSPPAVPVLTATALDTAAYLTWPNVGLATSYEYRIDGGTATTATSPTTITGLTNGTPYTVELRSLNVYGPSAWSTLRTVTPTPLFVHDEFTRASTTTPIGTPTQGGPWTLRSGQAGILNGVEAYNSAGSDTILTVPASFDVEVTMLIGSVTGNVTDCAIILRYSDTTHYFMMHGDGSGAMIYQRTPAGFLYMARMDRAMLVAGTVIRAIAYGKWLYFYRNNVLILKIQDPVMDTARTYAGFRMGGGSQRVSMITIAPRTTDPVEATHAGELTDPVNLSFDPPPPFVYKGRDTKAADTGSVV